MYQLQNRLQDGNWEDITGQLFEFSGGAMQRASYLSMNGQHFYGMVRVVDLDNGAIVVVYAAGGGKVQLESKPESIQCHSSVDYVENLKSENIILRSRLLRLTELLNDATKVVKGDQ